MNCSGGRPVNCLGGRIEPASDVSFMTAEYSVHTVETTLTIHHRLEAPRDLILPSPLRLLTAPLARAFFLGFLGGSGRVEKVQ